MPIVNLRNLQNTLHNCEIMHVQFVNFWPKPDPNPNREVTPNLTLILTLDKLHSTSCKLHRPANCVQQ